MMIATQSYSTRAEALAALQERIGDELAEFCRTADETVRAVELMAVRWVIRSADEQRGEPSWIVLGEVGDELWTRDLYRALYAAADEGFGEVCAVLESADFALAFLRERVGRSGSLLSESQLTALSEPQLTAVVHYLGQRFIARATGIGGEPVWLVIDPGHDAWDAALYAGISYAQASAGEA